MFPNAIRTYEEVLKPMGKRLAGVRIDSGDITYLTNRVREMLDEAGLQDCKIFVSNSLDEYIIRDILHQGAKVDYFGVGERLITSRSEPVFGGVYKLVAVEKDGKYIPKIKFSEIRRRLQRQGIRKYIGFFLQKQEKWLRI